MSNNHQTLLNRFVDIGWPDSDDLVQITRGEAHTVMKYVRELEDSCIASRNQSQRYEQVLRKIVKEEPCRDRFDCPCVDLAIDVLNPAL